MQIYRYFLNLWTTNKSNWDAYWAQRARALRMWQIEQDAISVFADISKDLPDYRDDTLKSQVQADVGDWDRLIGQDRHYHVNLHRKLAFQYRDEPGWAKDQVSPPSDSLIEKLTLRFKEEQNKKQEVFLRCEQEKVEAWKDANRSEDGPLPDKEEALFDNVLRAKIEADANAQALLSEQTAGRYRTALEAEYTNTLKRETEAFVLRLQEEAQQSKKTRDIFGNGKAVDHTDFSECFLASDNYLMDQIHRNLDEVFIVQEVSLKR